MATYSKAWYTFRANSLEVAYDYRSEIAMQHPDMKVHTFEIQEKTNSIGDFMHYIVYVGITDGKLDDD